METRVPVGDRFDVERCGLTGRADAPRWRGPEDRPTPFPPLICTRDTLPGEPPFVLPLELRLHFELGDRHESDVPSGPFPLQSLAAHNS